MQENLKRLGVGVSLVAAMLVGCYHPGKLVRLDYQPAPKRRAAPRGVSVEVGSFKDNRLDKDVGGVYQSSHVTSRAYNWGSIEDWVEEALAKELTLGGFDVVRSKKGAEETAAEFHISGQVLEAWARQADAISAQVVLLATVVRDGEEVFSRTYRGNAGVIHVFGTGKEFNSALSKALEKALAQLISEMQSLAEAGSEGG